MHSLHGKDGNTEWAAHFNGDLSGDVQFVCNNSDGEKRLHVPSDFVKKVIAEHLRTIRVSVIQNMTDDEILLGVQ